MSSLTSYPQTQIKQITVDGGISVFYREAGSLHNPTILLLHGYPSSSHQYRNLIPILAQKYHVLAPDFPGYGFTGVPAERQYQYTFESLKHTTLAFVDALGLARFAIYVFDYGAPTGFRIALERPESITAIISQNGNAYEEGLGAEFWSPIQTYWTDSSVENREALRPFVSFEGTKQQYTDGFTSPESVPPESYTLDAALLARPGNVEIQLDLFYDYRTNVSLYPAFQKYIRESGVPVLAIWGKNDPIFVEAGARAFEKDVKEGKGRVVLLNTGHFALESHVETIGEEILKFFDEQGV